VCSRLVTPLLVADPHSYRQFFQNLHYNIFGDGNGLVSAWSVFPQRVLILLATLPIFFIGMIALWRTGRIRETLVLFVAPVVGLGLVVFIR
jgi:hypothetical protein